MTEYTERIKEAQSKLEVRRRSLLYRQNRLRSIREAYRRSRHRAYMREYSQRPDVKAIRRIYMRGYRKRRRSEMKEASGKLKSLSLTADEARLLGAKRKLVEDGIWSVRQARRWLEQQGHASGSGQKSL